MPRSIASRLVGRAHHRQHDATCGLTAKPPGTQRSRLDDRVVLVDPRLGLLGLDEREAQRADALLGRQADRLAPRARDPQRRVGLLHRLGDDVARRHREEAAVDAGERLLDHHPRDDVERLLPLRALGLAVDAEALELGAARGLAGAELDAPAGDEVEHRGGLGHARGMLVAGRQRQDPEAEADALRALRGGAEEDARGARVRVLLEEVVLDLPHGVEADAVGELDLLERVLDAAAARRRRPTGGGAGARRRSRSAWPWQPSSRAFAAPAARLGSKRRRSPLLSRGVPMSRCARSLPLAALVVLWCAAAAPAARAAAGRRRAGRAVALRPRAQGLRGHRAQHDLEGLVHGRRRRAQRRLLPDQRQHQRRDAAVHRHRRLELHRPADARHDLHGQGDRRPRADLPRDDHGQERALQDRHRLHDRPVAPDGAHPLEVRRAEGQAVGLPPLRPPRPDAQRQRRRRQRPTTRQRRRRRRRPGQRRRPHAARRHRTPSPQTNAANRDYAIPVLLGARRQPRLRPGDQRLRRPAQRRPRPARRRPRA